MLAHHSTDVGVPGVGGALPGTSGNPRAARYLSSVGENSPALTDCARQARQQGLRVVTVAAEKSYKSDGSPPGVGLGGRRLRALVGRLEAGQFDVIVAHMGDAMITIGVTQRADRSEA